MKYPVIKSFADDNNISVTIENCKKSIDAPLFNHVKITCSAKRYTNEQLNLLKIIH